MINLERRPDRYRRVTESLQRMHVPNCRRFNAIDGSKFGSVGEMWQNVLNWTIDPAITDGSTPIDDTSIRYRGKTGCALSHLVTMHHIHHLPGSDDDWYILLEDDNVVVYPWHIFEQFFEEALRLFPNADYIHIGDRNGMLNYVRVFRQPGIAGNVYALHSGSTDCYAVRKGSCAKIIHEMNVSRKNAIHDLYAIDCWYEACFIMNRLNVGWFEYPWAYVSEYALVSDIETNGNDADILHREETLRRLGILNPLNMTPKYLSDLETSRARRILADHPAASNKSPTDSDASSSPHSSNTEIQTEHPDPA